MSRYEDAIERGYDPADETLYYDPTRPQKRLEGPLRVAFDNAVAEARRLREQGR